MPHCLQELSLSKHPHIVEFKEVFATPQYLAEVVEYVEGETLQVNTGVRVNPACKRPARSIERHLQAICSLMS